MLDMPNCFGCFKHNDKSCYMRVGFLTRKKESIICPCVDCLVKSMCSDICEEFNEYRYLLYKEMSWKHYDYEENL